MALPISTYDIRDLPGLTGSRFTMSVRLYPEKGRDQSVRWDSDLGTYTGSVTHYLLLYLYRPSGAKGKYIELTCLRQDKVRLLAVCKVRRYCEDRQN